MSLGGSRFHWYIGIMETLVEEAIEQYADRHTSPHSKKVRLEFGDALATLSKLQPESVDAMFIDADKAEYPSYYEEALRILRPGGWMALDNVLWDGQVVNPDNNDPEVDAVKRFNEKVRRDNRVDKVMLTLRDGVYLVRKR
jgi:predicted O-methyltransferase YrrM